MTCHFDGSKLHSTPSPGSVSPQISPMKTWIRTWGQPPTCWKHAGGMKSGLAAKARRCCSFNASSQVRSSETENSDSSTWAHGGGHFSWQRPLLKKPGPNGVAKKNKKKHSHFHLPFLSFPTVSKPPNPGPHLLLLSHFGALPCNVQGLHQALGAEAPWRLHADAAHGAHGAHGRLARAAGPRGGHGGSIAGSPKQRQDFRAIPWF